MQDYTLLHDVQTALLFQSPVWSQCALAGETSLPDAVLALYEKLSHVRFVITTMGTRGAVLLERLPGQAEAGAGVSHEQSMADVSSLSHQLCPYHSSLSVLGLWESQEILPAVELAQQ